MRLQLGGSWIVPLTSKAALFLAANHERAGNKEVAEKMLEYAIYLEGCGK